MTFPGLELARVPVPGGEARLIHTLLLSLFQAAPSFALPTLRCVSSGLQHPIHRGPPEFLCTWYAVNTVHGGLLRAWKQRCLRRNPPAETAFSAPGQNPGNGL